MRIVETFNKGRPKVSKTPLKSFTKAWLTDSLKLHPSDWFRITMHRRTAPNHIHIFIRLISSDSGTFSRHGKFTPSLDKVSANDRPLYTQVGSNACIFNTDWLQILQPRLFRTSLHTSQPGHKGDFEKILTHHLQQSEWRTHPEMSQRLLQPQHSPPFRLIKFSSRSKWSTWLSDYQAITWRIYILYTIPLHFLFWWICLPAKTSAWHFKDTLSNGTQSFFILNFQFLVLFKYYYPLHHT